MEGVSLRYDALALPPENLSLAGGDVYPSDFPYNISNMTHADSLYAVTPCRFSLGFPKSPVGKNKTS